MTQTEESNIVARLGELTGQMLDVVAFDSAGFGPQATIAAIISRIDDEALRTLVKGLTTSEQRRFARLLGLPGNVIPPATGFQMVRQRLTQAIDRNDLTAARILGLRDAERLAALPAPAANAGDLIDAIRLARPKIEAEIGPDRLALAAWVFSYRVGGPWPLVALGEAGGVPRIRSAVEVGQLRDLLAELGQAGSDALERVRELVEPWLASNIPVTAALLAAQLDELRDLLAPLSELTETVGSDEVMLTRFLGHLITRETV